MKRLRTKNIWFHVLICLLILASGSSVLAEEVVPGTPPGVTVRGGGSYIRPEGDYYSVDVPKGVESFLPSEPNPELMSWTTLLSEDFDSTFPYTGWANYGGWGTTKYRSYSGNKSLYPGAIGPDAYDPRASYYSNDMLSWIQYGPMSFDSATDARMEFNMWLDTEVGNDWINVCASIDGSSFSCWAFDGASEGWADYSLGFSNWWGLGDISDAPAVWIAFYFESDLSGTAPGVFIDNLVVQRTASALEPDMKLVSFVHEPNLYHPDDAINIEVEIANVGSENCVNYTIRGYLSYDDVISTGDIPILTANYISPPILPNEFSIFTYSPSIPGGLPPGIYYVGALVECLNDTNAINDAYANPNPIQVTNAGNDGVIFQDNFELHDLTAWTRFNPGNTGLSACAAGAFNGDHGACFYRPAGNNKRRQLIDETPVSQNTFNVRFNIDVSKLSMGNGERFRFLQTKMGAERPFFIVIKNQGGQYLIQLNALLDDRTKVKTGWYVLTEAPHLIEINWQTSTGPGNNDGFFGLILDESLAEANTALDNDTIYVDSLKIGFTSRLDGKSIRGTFYVDDVATSNGGYIGPP